jgi:WD40 repeat protein
LLGSAGFHGIILYGSAEHGEPTTPEPPRDLEAEDPDEAEEERTWFWDEGDVDQVAHLCFHEGPVSDIAFSKDSSLVLSGGYDSTIHISDISEGRTSSIWSASTNGLVQCVGWAKDPNIFFFGTSRKLFCIGDLRVPSGTVSTMANDAMVNAA